MTDTDLFGQPLPPPKLGDPGAPIRLTSGGKRKRRPTKPNGYAAQPGLGPTGETCGTCEHKVRKRMGGSYLKCGLMVKAWTGGPGTDILARSPACAKWERSRG